MMSKMTIDYAAKKIILARTFAKNAKKAGTAEYAELQAIREQHPGFDGVEREYNKSTTQEHYAGMTYAYMVEYIIRHEQPEKRDEMLKKLRIQYNSIRQAAITREMTEIAAGAKALRKKRKKAGEDYGKDSIGSSS